VVTKVVVRNGGSVTIVWPRELVVVKERGLVSVVRPGTERGSVIEGEAEVDGAVEVVGRR
jgi:hypothetical protein